MGLAGPGGTRTHGAEDPIDEAGRIVAAEEFRQLDSLVDRGPHWNLIIDYDLIDGKTKYVPVNRRELIHRPRWRGLADDLVDPLL